MKKKITCNILFILLITTTIPTLGSLNKNITIPNDEYFNLQYSLHNTGQTGGITDCDIDAPEAWDIETGSSDVVIAFMDSGIDYTHPDLASKIWINVDEIPGNGIDDDSNGYIDDVRGWDFYHNDNDPLDQNGHGTICAGIAAAVTNNGTGIAGVCWDCQIMPLKVNGLYNTEDIPNLWIDAIYYAVDNDADIISMSLGIEYYHPQLEDAVNYAYNSGVFLTASAGNQGWSDEHYPAAYDNVVGVAATNDEDKRMENAGQWSASSNYGPWVDVAAPGEDIFSTMPTYHVTFNDYGFNYNYMGDLCGTSCSAPHVAGLAALILSKNSSYNPEEVKTLILHNVDPYNSSFDLGTGRINAFKALQNLTINNIPLTIGWNQISIPVDNPNYGMASNLADLIINCTELDYWNNTMGQYQTWIPGWSSPVDDFEILPGRSYFVYVSSDSNFMLTGLSVSYVSIPLDSGWNMIGWFNETATSASSLSDNITGCTELDYWNNTMGQYQTWIPGWSGPEDDFLINQGMGIFVYVNQSSIWHGEG